MIFIWFMLTFRPSKQRGPHIDTSMITMREKMFMVLLPFSGMSNYLAKVGLILVVYCPEPRAAAQLGQILFIILALN